MVYTKRAGKKRNAIVRDSVSSLAPDDTCGLGGGEEGVREREPKRQVVGGKGERERLNDERRAYLMIEAIVRRYGIGTVNLVLQRLIDAGAGQPGEADEGRKLRTVREIAELAGVVEGTVHDWVAKKKLKVHRYELYSGPTGGEVFRELIDEGEFWEFWGRRPGPGRPKVRSGTLDKPH